jgi:hypothetical protein
MSKEFICSEKKRLTDFLADQTLVHEDTKKRPGALRQRRRSCRLRHPDAQGSRREPDRGAGGSNQSAGGGRCARLTLSASGVCAGAGASACAWHVEISKQAIELLEKRSYLLGRTDASIGLAVTALLTDLVLDAA